MQALTSAMLLQVEGFSMRKVTAVTALYPTMTSIRAALTRPGEIAAAPLRMGLGQKPITLGSAAEKNLRVALFGNVSVDPVVKAKNGGLGGIDEESVMEIEDEIDGEEEEGDDEVDEITCTQALIAMDQERRRSIFDSDSDSGHGSLMSVADDWDGDSLSTVPPNALAGAEVGGACIDLTRESMDSEVTVRYDPACMSSPPPSAEDTIGGVSPKKRSKKKTYGKR